MRLGLSLRLPTQAKLPLGTVPFSKRVMCTKRKTAAAGLYEYQESYVLLGKIEVGLQGGRKGREHDKVSSCASCRAVANLVSRQETPAFDKADCTNQAIKCALSPRLAVG